MSSDNNEDELLQSGNEMSTMVANPPPITESQDLSYNKKLTGPLPSDIGNLRKLRNLFSIWVDKPTPGIALLNLRYRDEHVVEPRDKDRKV
ncbi:hypothetical protein JHK85_001106 [Glycine max]|nr:hypothetical protein JHK85_001106 [Glycine max]KAG5088461.1 hypothetical protein JHK86_001073 [Glycine max]